MSTLDTMIKFFQDSGMFIYVSIAILALGLAIAIERFVFLQRARQQNRRMWDSILPMLKSGQFKEVQGATARRDSAIGLIVHNGLSRMQSARRREDVDAAMEEGMMEIIPRLEKRTHYIATFANVVTLVGLLGTIIGLIQAFTAIWQLELVNYIEHYGLTRRHLGNGRYEHVLPRHSWNAEHRASNWLLINLQRHSDHHYKPDRRFPVLQTYPKGEAPQLPYGYPLMTMAAMVPPLKSFRTEPASPKRPHGSARCNLPARRPFRFCRRPAGLSNPAGPLRAMPAAG